MAQIGQEVSMRSGYGTSVKRKVRLKQGIDDGTDERLTALCECYGSWLLRQLLGSVKDELLCS